MRSQLSAFLDSAITVLLLLVGGITPLLFLNLTTEFYEMPKLIFLLVSTILLLALWIGSWIVRGKIAITRTPLDIPLLALLGVILLSTFFSNSRIISTYGNFPAVHGSAVSWCVYILLYFVTVSHLKTLAKIKAFLFSLYASATVVSLITLASFFKLYLPFDFAQGVNFTPTGSSFSTIAFLILLLPLPLLSILHPKKYLPTPAALVLAVLFSVTVVLIGSLPSYITLVAAYALSLILSRPNQLKKSLSLFLVPLIAVGITLSLAYLPLPGGLREMEANFPKEIQLPFPISWKISASAFRDSPFIGTGPSTYLFNFTSYKPVEFNTLQFWNFSFESAYNEFLQTLASLGILGLISLLVVCLVVLVNSWRNIMQIGRHNEDTSEHASILPASLGITGILAIILLAIHASTLVSAVMTLLLLAVFMASQKHIREKVTELSMGIKASTADNKQLDLLPLIAFVLFLILAVPVSFKTVNAVSADYYHRLALAQANKNGTLTYQYLQKAESLNPQIDLYRVDMAQTNFALANAIATNAQKDAEGKITLSEQDRNTIQTLLSQAVNEGRVAVALSPRSSRNWEVLASIYRNITGVAQNALAFSLDAYGRAIQRDPLNPALRLNVGGIYYAAQNYDLAIRFFSDAANLKPDYVNAYYNLSIALRDKGDLENARLVAEQTVALLQKDKNSQDYKTAVKLLDELKAKAATGQKATAGQTENALTGSDVDVNNLNNPPEVATPAAVPQNPDARIPQLTPAPQTTEPTQ
jgi:O-antigen ligase/Flp pilus assembly protein TadD